ncbi:helix-turn-helix domain-containing protein [Zavarzinella formosa]|uniref:helix-turn-helix domain-containing protein n=1 Tax=Zavarzinella formosa TaxID=360055 RepID=UPI0002EE13A8|nr:helix-turn-helix transcriptional regulator [Zavarzinella formosa]
MSDECPKFADFIKARLKERGTTQKAVAEAIGATQSNLNWWVKENRWPKDRIKAFCSELGLEAVDLYEGTTQTSYLIVADGGEQKKFSVSGWFDSRTHTPASPPHDFGAVVEALGPVVQAPCVPTAITKILNTLKDGDYLITTRQSTRPRLLSKGRKYADCVSALMGAADRGLQTCFILPTSDSSRNFMKRYYIQDVPRAWYCPETFDEFVTAYKRRLAEAGDSNSDSTSQSRFQSLEWDDFPMSAFGTEVMLIGTRGDCGLPIRKMFTFVTMEDGAIMIVHDRHIAIERMRAYFRVVLEESAARAAPVQARFYNQIVDKIIGG